MKNLAPQIFRQRLLIEGLFSIRLDQQILADYMTGLAGHLGLHAYGQPAIYSPGGLGKEENQGYDAFLPLIDSGIAAYVWSSARFFSVVMYTCARFDADAAVQFTREFFAADEVATMEF
jgi:S-adenosylmethionine/arginine decarboxylase-like enzyme